jgi:cytosine/adenosine deaminase-related metal-dependent hydrolase
MTVLESVDLLGLEGPGTSRRVDIAIDGATITAVTPASRRPGRRLLAMPAMANAHDHARPLSPTSFGGAGKPLESWLLRLAAMPAVDAQLAATATLGRAARGGCASVMAHCTRLQGPVEEAASEVARVAQAAKTIGVRVTFAMYLRDRNPVVYGPHEPVLAAMPESTARTIDTLFSAAMPSPREQIARVEEIAAAAQSPTFQVQFGPTAVQWCSDGLLEAIADHSARTGRRVHMHMLETRYQREWADANYPQGILRHLKDIGLLTPRLALAHCVHARAEDLDLIAEAGATIVTNPSSNLHLASGIAPIAEALMRGCRVAIGVDASAFDEDDDAIRELRLAHFLHGGWGFDENISREGLLAKAVEAGRFANGAPGNGRIAAGAPADLMLLDLDALDADAVMPVDPLDFVFARATRRHIAHLYVAGREVVRDGKVTGVDLDAVHQELRAQVRSRMPGRRAFLDAWPHLEPAVATFYRDRLGCC